jgi:hypothetical protein
MNLKRFAQTLLLTLVCSTSIKPDLGGVINPKTIACIRRRLNLRTFVALMPPCLAVPRSWDSRAWENDPRPCAANGNCRVSRVYWAAGEAANQGNVGPVVSAILANQPCRDEVLNQLKQPRFAECDDIPLF